MQKPVLRYYGSKWTLAPWIISLFPQHGHFIDACGGSASILLQKPPSRLETYNDLDSRVVNFFRVCRDRPGELSRAVTLTPYSRVEFFQARQPAPDDPLEDARRFAIVSWMSISGGYFETNGGTWRVTKGADSRWSTASSDWLALPKTVLAVAKRLAGVQIECEPAESLIERYAGKGTLFYIDPPYLPHTRRHPKVYTFEVEEQWHRDIFRRLQEAQAMAIVSGYKSQLYRELYESAGWRRLDKRARTNSGQVRTESVWISPNCTTAQQPRLF